MSSSWAPPAGPSVHKLIIIQFRNDKYLQSEQQQFCLWILTCAQNNSLLVSNFLFSALINSLHGKVLAMPWEIILYFPPKMSIREHPTYLEKQMLHFIHRFKCTFYNHCENIWNQPTEFSLLRSASSQRDACKSSVWCRRQQKRKINWRMRQYKERKITKTFICQLVSMDAISNTNKKVCYSNQISFLRLWGNL